METASSDPVAPTTLTLESLEFYRREGYLVLPRVLAPADAAAMRREVLGIMDIIGLGKSKLRQTTEYLAGGPLDTFVNSPNLLAIAAALMEGPSTLYMPFTAVKSGAVPGEEVGGGEFHFHQDNQYTRFDGPGINLWFALSPMREENGCLRILPGSHRDGTLADGGAPDKDGHRTVPYEVKDSVPILMEPGDCVAFSRLTVHGSGPNHAPEHRVAYAVQFHRDDVNASRDGGQTYESLKTHPRYRTGPVAAISIPKGKVEGH